MAKKINKRQWKNEKKAKERCILRYCEERWQDFIDELDVVRAVWCTGPEFPETKDDFYYALDLWEESNEWTDFEYNIKRDGMMETYAHDFIKSKIEEMFYEMNEKNGVFNSPPYLVR